MAHAFDLMLIDFLKPGVSEDHIDVSSCDSAYYYLTVFNLELVLMVRQLWMNDMKEWMRMCENDMKEWMNMCQNGVKQCINMFENDTKEWMNMCQNDMKECINMSENDVI